MIKIKSFAIDCDGTFLSSHHNVSKENMMAFKTLKEKGLVPFFCTSRSTYAIHQFVDKSTLSEMDYFNLSPGVFLNGCYVLGKDGEVLYYKKMTYFEIEKCIEILKSLDVYSVSYAFGIDYTSTLPQLWNSLELKKKKKNVSQNNIDEANKNSNNSTYNSDKQKEFKKNEDGSYDIDDYLDYLEKNDNTLNSKENNNSFQKDCVTILVRCNALYIDSFQKNLKLLLPETLSCHQASSEFIEIFINGVNKRTGVELILQNLSLDLNSLAAIGDNENDIPMLEAAKLSFAMGNGSKLCKETADIVVKTNNENGFCEAVDIILNQ